MRRLLLALAIFAVVSKVDAADIFVTKFKNQADAIVYVTPVKAETELFVLYTKIRSEAVKRDDIWYFVNSQGQASFTIYMTNNKNEATLKIQYVSVRGQAGWSKSNKYRGRIGGK